MPVLSAVSSETTDLSSSEARAIEVNLPPCKNGEIKRRKEKYQSLIEDEHGHDRHRADPYRHDQAIALYESYWTPT
jgi:hypothetical protein